MGENNPKIRISIKHVFYFCVKLLLLGIGTVIEPALLLGPFRNLLRVPEFLRVVHVEEDGKF